MPALFLVGLTGDDLMSFPFAASRRFARTALYALIPGLLIATPSLAGAETPAGSTVSPVTPTTPTLTTPTTTTPITHLIVIIGENRTFDHLFATYQPQSGQTVDNLLSRGIVQEDGGPGPNYAQARQYRAENRQTYTLAPAPKTPYDHLPPPMTEEAEPEGSDTAGPPLKSAMLAAMLGTGLPSDSVGLLLTGATGLPKNSVDSRYRTGQPMPDGPYPLTPTLPYDAYTGGPVHRFFQMWQQVDCAVDHATSANPSGCLSDLYPWIETSVGKGSNGEPQPAGFNEASTGEGSNAMGIYNIAHGDLPYLKTLADRYALADNYHQAIMGGTGANHVALGTGDAIWYSDAAGNPAVPPANQIENPNPQPGTNNFYAQDGYAGGSYANCSDRSQPGVAAILDYLAALPGHPDPKCEPGHYYLLNNYNPAYLGDGSLDKSSPFVLPPSRLRTIGDALSEHQVSWRWYGESWNLYVNDPTNPLFCNNCNPSQFTTQVMADPAARQSVIKDLPDFYNDLAHDTLPAVSLVKPNALNDGHPASSKLDLFEGFTRKLIEAVQQHPELWQSTAIMITFDEGGGYYDSGYIQPLDFFGDGPRVPLIVVSPYAGGGRVIHTYSDHVSILKFIERNWRLPPLTARSRDNLPNPEAAPATPYVPTNGPAIGDLMEMFRF
jgi:phospholipase C